MGPPTGLRAPRRGNWGENEPDQKKIQASCSAQYVKYLLFHSSSHSSFILFSHNARFYAHLLQIGHKGLIVSCVAITGDQFKAEVYSVQRPRVFASGRGLLFMEHTPRHQCSMNWLCQPPPTIGKEGEHHTMDVYYLHNKAKAAETRRIE